VFGTSGSHRFTSVSDHLRRVLGDVETVTIPDGRHNVHRNAPEAFADLVRHGISRAAD
jgi:pimeloyl-ACP methyl ester carboxylesterase